MNAFACEKNQIKQTILPQRQKLGEELAADVAEFNSRRGGAYLSQPTPDQFRVTNADTAMQLIISADFDASDRPL